MNINIKIYIIPDCNLRTIKYTLKVASNVTVKKIIEYICATFYIDINKLLGSNSIFILDGKNIVIEENLCKIVTSDAELIIMPKISGG
jgi:hypothetical protein